MNPGTVPQAEVNVDAGGNGVQSNDNGNANTGGVQVQNVTVQANPTSGAEAASSNTITNGAEAINKARTSAENTNNALLLQQIELDRLKAEQKRVQAINQFGDTLNSCQGPSCPVTLPAPAPAPAAPCGVGPCVPNQSPVIENTIINDSVIKSSSVEVEEEVDNSPGFMANTKWGISPIVGMRWFSESNNAVKAKITNEYIVGAAVVADLNKWASAEGSFVYGKDRVEGHPCMGCLGWRQSERDSYEIGIGAKLGPRFQNFRPYASLGLGTLIQTYEFNNGNRTTYNVEGNIGGGADFLISKNFAIGAKAEYQGITGSSDNYLSDVYGDDANRYRIGATATVTF
jgi:hypothetical protein